MSVSGWFSGIGRIISPPRWLDSTALRLFPPTCLLCGAAGQAARDLCAGCEQDLPRNQNPCARCAEPLPARGASHLICGRCQQAAPAYEHTIAPFLYQPPLAGLIQELKFSGRLVNARLLTELLAAAIDVQDLPQALLPVPLHPRRLRSRGFNQALVLARPLARRFELILLSDSVRRIRHSVPQTELGLEARLSSLRGAFAVRRPLAVSHVAILDDVVTTGSTVNEIARVLRAAGVERIQVWACARTPKIPPTPLLQRGELITPLCKRGVRGSSVPPFCKGGLGGI